MPVRDAQRTWLAIGIHRGGDAKCSLCAVDHREPRVRACVGRVKLDGLTKRRFSLGQLGDRDRQYAASPLLHTLGRCPSSWPARGAFNERCRHAGCDSVDSRDGSNEAIAERTDGFNESRRAGHISEGFAQTRHMNRQDALVDGALRQSDVKSSRLVRTRPWRTSMTRRSCALGASAIAWPARDSLLSDTSSAHWANAYRSSAAINFRRILTIWRLEPCDDRASLIP